MVKRINTYGLKKAQLIGLALFVIIALGHKMISNEKFSTLIPYSYQTIDKDNRNVGPFDTQDVKSLRHRHWLGTDTIGRDVLAGMLAGTAIAFWIGSVSVILALVIGVFFGYLSGYLGDDRFRLHRKDLLVGIFAILVSAFYTIYGSGWSIALGLLVMGIIIMILVRRSNPRPEKNTWAIPFDLIIMRLIEVFRAIPHIFLILVLLALFREPNYWNVILIIALVRWPAVTRYIRAEILKIKAQNFIASAESIGLPQWKIFKDHILAMAIAPAIVTSAFGFSMAILLESTLSFLGIGVPIDKVTWGSMLNEARHSFSSWWLAVFPGLAIYAVIYLFNSIGDSINEYLLGRR